MGVDVFCIFGTLVRKGGAHQSPFAALSPLIQKRYPLTAGLTQRDSSLGLHFLPTPLLCSIKWVKDNITVRLTTYLISGHIDARCSPSCLETPVNGNGSACNEATQECLYGCQDGYGGERCQFQCAANCSNCTVIEYEYVNSVF